VNKNKKLLVKIGASPAVPMIVYNYSQVLTGDCVNVRHPDGSVLYVIVDEVKFIGNSKIICVTPYIETPDPVEAEVNGDIC